MAALIFAVVFLASSLAAAQTSAPTLPDYSGWEPLGKRSGSAVHNGKDIVLSDTRYERTDFQALRRQIVQIFYNESGAFWLAFYFEEVGERDSQGAITTAEEDVFLFEHKDGNWIFVKEWSRIKDFEGVYKFLEEHYHLMLP